MHPTRRFMVRTGVLAGLSPVMGKLGLPTLARPTAARAGDPERKWRHGLSLFGELKYPPGFARFDHVNPDAPKLGAAVDGMERLRQFQLGRAGVKGRWRPLELMTDSRLRAFDELGTQYG